MNQYYRAIRIFLLVFCGGCLIFALVFLAQIQEQKRQIQLLQDLKTEVDWLLMQSETESVKTETRLKKELIQKSQEIANKQELIWAYKEKGQAMKEQEDRILDLQAYYEKELYLDSLAVERDRENGDKSCIERYFRIEKGEVEQILGGKDAPEELQADFPNAVKWGCLLAAGDGIWLRYDEDATQNALPMGIVIRNPLVKIGYKDARAGMYLYDIEKTYSESAVEKAEAEGEMIRYLRYADEKFIYYYVAVSDLGDAVIEYIVPNNEYILRGNRNEE